MHIMGNGSIACWLVSWYYGKETHILLYYKSKDDSVRVSHAQEGPPRGRKRWKEEEMQLCAWMCGCFTSMCVTFQPVFGRLFTMMILDNMVPLGKLSPWAFQRHLEFDDRLKSNQMKKFCGKSSLCVLAWFKVGISIPDRLTNRGLWKPKVSVVRPWGRLGKHIFGLNCAKKKTL